MTDEQPEWADPEHVFARIVVGGDLIYDPSSAQWLEVERREHYGNDKMALFINDTRHPMTGSTIVRYRKRTSNV